MLKWDESYECEGNKLSSFNDLSDKTDEEIKEFSDKIYEFQSQLVRDGQKYVRMVRKSSLKAYTSLNVCVMGDATEEFTQLLFPSVALLLQKEKGRMLANHIHQGMSVIGALYVPSSINSEEVSVRENMLRTLMEIDVQHKVSTVPGYDHVILYQDVQNRYEKFYSLLNDDEQAEFIYQSLIHLYYACNTQHPLISGVAAADSFYISIGVASMVFDEDQQGGEVGAEVCKELLAAFYANPREDNYVEGVDDREKRRKLIPKQYFEPKKILDFFRLPEVDLERKMDEPSPHPIFDFKEKYLKRRYYKQYLRYSVAEFRRMMDDAIESKTRTSLEIAHNSFVRRFEDMQRMKFPSAILKFVEDSNPSDGGILYLEAQLKELKEELAEQKKRLPMYVEEHIWTPSINTVPEKYRDYYVNYHDEAYKRDIEENKGDKYTNEMKNAAINDLCNHQKQEAPVLGHLARTFLLALVTVIMVLPILNIALPRYWHVRQTAGLWAGICFGIPVLIELYKAIRYLIKRERKFDKLRGYCYHDAFARVANRILTESNNYYDKLMVLCDRYIERAEKIRKEVCDIEEENYEESDLPINKFNQPLVNSNFCGRTILTEKSLEPKQIYINHIKKPVDDLTAENYYSLIHLLKDDIMILFQDVRNKEDHPYEEMNDGTGTVRLLSAEDIENREKENWENIKAKFKQTLLRNIKNELVPLQYPSACEMLMQSYRSDKRKSIIKPFINFAATNGEFTTSANIEYADVKTQSEKISDLICDYLPDRTVYQKEEYVEEKEGQIDFFDEDETIFARKLYKKYIFLTRWYSYEELSLNRILPMEDFDIEERKKQVNEKEFDLNKKNGDKVTDYVISSSSTLLWSLCAKDNSILWLKLFHTDVLNKARRISDDIFNETLTQKD